MSAAYQWHTNSRFAANVLKQENEIGAIYNKQKILTYSTCMLHSATVPITELFCDISADRDEAWAKV